MFKRRPPRGGFRRAGKPEVPPLLKRANHFFFNGQFAEASETFEELAERALARGGPRAPLFFLQAGRARILNGESQLGVERLQQGLKLFVEYDKAFRAQRAGERICAELQEHGLTDEAQQIQTLLAVLPKLNAASEKTAPTPHLPTHCPACGAALKPDEVEWLDDITAECEYCGSPVRGEQD
ncbi:MAG: hypothetical protein IT310_06225 [Anaerolineales bacterium]|nr:hypothetical protein [Anaerolineales bacterium]